MKLYPDKLSAHLAKQTAPVYLLHGDEPLQLMELADQLRAHASQLEFEERQVFLATEDTDWQSFRESVDSRSLFAEKRLIELRLPTGKPGRAGGDMLREYCSNPPEDVLLLISSAKLDRGGSSSAWFKAVDKAGVTIAVYPIAPAQLINWLSGRCAKLNLKLDAAALQLLAERVEGNLLAASQEIQRLALLYPAGDIGPDEVLAAVTDSARYSISDLSDAVLRGSARRALKILQGLQSEATAPVLVLWSLASEIRSGTRVSEATAKGQSLESALKAAGVWQSRAAPLKQALGRHGPNSWLDMLRQTSFIDRQIKGQEQGNVWDSFARLCVELANRPAVKKENRYDIIH
ncbi:MAG: DNA polymerase III subunit delta [Gammaproteobacteria bacterium]|nr:DNA polymerase III subunit delta [Gammaproteobacteria bacterium]